MTDNAEELRKHQLRIHNLERELSWVRGTLDYMRNKGLSSALAGVYPVFDDIEKSSTEYWTDYNVTQHLKFSSHEESLAALEFRNQQYPGYIDLMPNAGRDGQVVVDYGCGPGHDLVGFSHYSRPKRLLGLDVSRTSLEQARKRLALHGAEAELIQLEGGKSSLPLPDASVDCVHCSGVLMLVPDPEGVLAEFRRILKPGGEVRLMVYNHDSLWLHLYTAYIVKVEYGLYQNLSVEEAFCRTTDGENCPLVRVWRPSEVIEMMNRAGLACEFIGAAPSLWEMSISHRRFEALMSSAVASEHRGFLSRIAVDQRGVPYVDGHVAGVDGCFRGQPG